MLIETVPLTVLLADDQTKEETMSESCERSPLLNLAVALFDEKIIR